MADRVRCGNQRQLRTSRCPGNPTEALSIKEAIYCYTKAAETSCKTRIGALKEGGFADLLCEDPCRPARLKDIKVLKTYVNGMPV